MFHWGPPLPFELWTLGESTLSAVSADKGLDAIFLAKNKFLSTTTWEKIK